MSKYVLTKEISVSVGTGMTSAGTNVHRLTPHVSVHIALSKDVTAELVMDREEAIRAGFLEKRDRVFGKR